jgi:HAD superfamily hydrolase (TIGR01509 family)
VTELLPAAVLWDMDGTIVDTEPYWMAAETELVESFGGTWTHADAVQLVGAGLWHSARVLQSHGVALSEDEIINRMTDRVLDRVAESVPWRPGARELLLELSALGIKTGLVTMSIRRMALAVAQHLQFDVVIAGDDVTHSKPHPEPYELAAARLGVDVTHCVAIEDSAPGIASAVAAGAVVVGVPLHVPVDPESSWEAWSGLDGRTAADLFSTYAVRRSQ